MSDKFAALILLLVLLLSLSVSGRYVYLAWFKSDEFKVVAKNRLPEWQKRSPFFRPLINWMDTPSYLWIAKISVLAGFLIFVFIFILTIYPIISVILINPQ